MTTRDRTVVMVLGLFAMVAAFWFLLLAPKRAEVATLKDGVAAAQLRLQTANSAATHASAAKASYLADYRAVADLGKAVPADDDIPSLVFQLQTASKASRIAFDSIKLTGAAAPAPPPVTTTSAQVAGLAQEQKGGAAAPPATGATGPVPAPAGAAPAAGVPAAGTPASPAVPAAQTAFAGLPPGASVGPAGLPTMPFDFQFSGPFPRLEQLLRRIDAFTKTSKGQIKVNGRLMTIDSIALSGFPQMTAKIHATAFLLPAGQGLLAGASAGAPGSAPGAVPASVAPPAATGSAPGAAVPVTPVATAAPAAGVGR